MRRPLEEVGSPAVRVCEGRAAQCSLPRGKVGEPGVGVPLAPSGPSESSGGRLEWRGWTQPRYRKRGCSGPGGVGSILTLILRERGVVEGICSWSDVI